MKYRNNFITNSSSSSFTVNKRFLTPFTIKILKDPTIIKDQLVPEFGDIDFYMEEAKLWNITEDEDYVYGFTSMDNFNYEQVFQIIGLDYNRFKD